jgi:hypothetical protein
MNDLLHFPHTPSGHPCKPKEAGTLNMETRNSTVAAAILGISIAIGLAVAGFFVSNTLYKGRLASNTVTVKGFAERDVKADLALWQISYSLTGGNLGELYSQTANDQRAVIDFLAQRGFQKHEIKSGDIQIDDLLANRFRANGVTEAQRYILKNTISVRSNNVELVAQTRSALNDLIKQGIVLTSNSVDFQFTRLNDIKASMLRAATENARGAAQQFANDANSTVGSIQSANQGFFSIDSRDSPAAQNPDAGQGYFQPSDSTIDKRVRVVVTLTYYLEK